MNSETTFTSLKNASFDFLAVKMHQILLLWCMLETLTLQETENEVGEERLDHNLGNMKKLDQNKRVFLVATQSSLDAQELQKSPSQKQPADSSCVQTSVRFSGNSFCRCVHPCGRIFQFSAVSSLTLNFQVHYSPIFVFMLQCRWNRF